VGETLKIVSRACELEPCVCSRVTLTVVSKVGSLVAGKVAEAISISEIGGALGVMVAIRALSSSLAPQ